VSIAKEFKEFAAKGNVIDLAVGVIIGAAFGKVVSSLVDDVIMPPIGMMLSGVDFTKLSIVLKDAVGDQPAVLIRYGAFINTCITFLIVAFCVFLMVKTINKMNRKKEAAPTPPPVPSQEIVLLGEIRDALKVR
jgi:large conductance mechanosensitive channel